MDRKLSGALDDRAVFAGKNQGGLDTRAGGEMGEERGNMLGHLLRALLSISQTWNTKEGECCSLEGWPWFCGGGWKVERRAVDESAGYGLTGQATHRRDERLSFLYECPGNIALALHTGYLVSGNRLKLRDQNMTD